MAKVRMYTSAICPFCRMAEQLLKSKGIEQIEKIRIDLKPEVRMQMIELTGRRTVPQIFIGDTHVGGFDDLAALHHAGDLDALLAQR